MLKTHDKEVDKAVLQFQWLIMDNLCLKTYDREADKGASKVGLKLKLINTHLES